MSTIQQFDYNAQLNTSVVWQYNQALNLQSLVNSVQEYFDTNQTEFWESWYSGVFNIYSPTFNAFGAMVWSIILGVPLQSDVLPDEENKPILIFDQTATGTPVYSTFDTSVFSYNNDSILLTLPEQILVLKLRAFQLNTRGAVTQINQFMQTVFADFEGFNGTCYVIDGGLSGSPMTMEYVFTQAISAGLMYILTHFDIMPRPAGVAISFSIVPTDAWGFDNGVESGYTVENFDNGPFFQSFGPVESY